MLDYFLSDHTHLSFPSGQAESHGWCTMSAPPWPWRGSKGGGRWRTPERPFVIRRMAYLVGYSQAQRNPQESHAPGRGRGTGKVVKAFGKYPGAPKRDHLHLVSEWITRENQSEGDALVLAKSVANMDHLYTVQTSRSPLRPPTSLNKEARWMDSKQRTISRRSMARACTYAQQVCKVETETRARGP